MHGKHQESFRLPNRLVTVAATVALIGTVYAGEALDASAGFNPDGTYTPDPTVMQPDTTAPPAQQPTAEIPPVAPANTNLAPQADTNTVTISPPLSPTPLSPPTVKPFERPSELTTYRMKVGGRVLVVTDPGSDKRITAVVEDLHRFNMSPDDELAATKLTASARKYGWLVLYPSGLDGSWNATGCCGVAKQEGRDDVSYIDMMTKTIDEQYGLKDVAHVITGSSNGGMMAEKIVCKRPGLFDGLVLDAANGQDPSCDYSVRAPYTLIMRGLRDGTVPINGIAWNTFLHTSLRGDQPTLRALRRGSTCYPVSQSNRAGIISSFVRCGNGYRQRYIKYVEDQAGHGLPDSVGAGIMDRKKLTVDAIRQSTYLASSLRAYLRVARANLSRSPTA